MKYWLGTLCLLTWIVPAHAAVTLDSVFDSAVERSEVISDQNEQIVQAEENYRKVLGAALPNISGVGSYLRQDSGGANGQIFPTAQPLIKLALTQPLFRGLREFHALKQSRSLVNAQSETKQQALQQLFLDVAQNYYTILSMERDLRNFQSQLELFVKRIKELRDRVKIGRSRLTEVLTVETSMGSLKAQIEQTKGQLAAARELFAFQTGLVASTELTDDTELPPKLGAVETYLGQKEARPEIKAAQLRLDAAREGVTVAKGARWPSVDLNANYYFLRYGSLENVRWDVQGVVTIPLFAGGVIDSNIQTASSQEQQSSLALSRAKRQIDDEIHTYYHTAQADLAQLAELKDTRDIAEKNFKEQTREYRLGLVTNLDVLQAMTSFYDSQRALDRGLYLGKLDVARLEAATGNNQTLKKRK